MTQDRKPMIREARTAEDLAGVRDLFREYASFLAIDLEFQSFEQELASLPGDYAAPTGSLLIAVDAGSIIGCVALRKMSKNTCEMKRLYVKPTVRGKGVGRELAQEIIRIAQQLGYNRMKLDTLSRLKTAVQLYRSLGFRETPAYYENPLPDVVYWELQLDGEF